MTVGIILAGGKGTRLRPLTYFRPKPLVPIGNRPIIDYVIDVFIKHGITKILVLVNYLGESIRNYLVQRNFPKDIELKVLNLNSIDTADAVRKARHEIEGDFIVSMGDILSNINLSNLMKFHRKNKGIATVALKEYENPLEYGVTLIDRNDRIVLFLEKPLSYELYLTSLAYHKSSIKFLHGNLVNAGVYAFKEEILDIITQNPHLLDWGKHVFPYLLENNYPVYGWIMGKSYWLDIGNPSKYLRANIDILSGSTFPIKPIGRYLHGIWTMGDIEIRSNAKIIPPVAIGNGVIIEAYATVGPYTVLGDNCKVGKSAIIKRSVVWEEASIGENSKIVSTILADNVLIGKNVSIIKSIIGKNVVIEEGVTLDNIAIEPKTRILAKEKLKEVMSIN